MKSSSLPRIIVRKLFLFSLFLITSTTLAWDGHFSLSYVALKNMPEIAHKATIPAETLTAFLQKERLGLVKLLRENEIWSQQNIPYYPPVPHDLVFKGDDSKPLKMQFVEAIRINPNLKFPLFVQYPPGEKHRIQGHPLVKRDVMLPLVTKAGWVYVPNPPLEGLSPGEKVSPLEIITSASDEPDYGMDTDLWENNPSWFAKEDHWGKQPFGDPGLLLSSQAPFHMAFYYESPLIYKVAPFLKYSYLEYRLHLYRVLSQYAFQTGHPYWGYRFLGWSIHYAQDLTQPYHSTAQCVGDKIDCREFIEADRLYQASTKRDSIKF
ncbi:hypothetical protein [Coxiella burnetii]|uniref:hypothetical protein n=1 Tax=Coxiella burnetii TaxID=777 RepID=UPI00030ED478|nr:hypothetical protein [Coxiella burnetii]ARI66601.1 hypothetical protein B7L74_09520 [Coxiella burnetii]ARK28041.1 hypothetical protein BMW92_09255 [Coxiella burnetii]ATN75124.1 hypothetical protein AYM90_09215 [Coxiella burnetii]ATN77034.1 hypothetical protein AYM94_09230 [Coxiella burnetii]ATN78950.1 hypothetical protein AYM93_09225 [Coxiella burnetii]